MPLSAATCNQDRAWLISATADFWLVCAGGGSLLVILALVLHYCGDAQLSLADILLGELHLGATYGVIAQRRLWRRMPLDIVVAPICILTATYAMTYGGETVLLATIALYLAAWHRGRQNLGVARYYQLHIRGTPSPAHDALFKAAVYLPMIAGVAYFTSTSPLHEGEEFIRLAIDPRILWTLGGLAMASLGAYLGYAAWHTDRVHSGEWWLVIANALAFASAYVLGAWSFSFILVLALHHEVQYLCFTYAVHRRGDEPQRAMRSELRSLAAFALWPGIGLASWAACKLSDAEWLAPLLVGGLLCHYWLDGRIWTARARRLAGG